LSRRTLFSYIVVAIAISILTVSSPLLLHFLSSRAAIDWSVVSQIGESYGFVSAIFSALAFGAVALSMQRQTQEAKALRAETRRATHNQLWAIGLADQDLAACFPGFYSKEPMENKQFHFINLFFWWWHSDYEAGVMTDEELRLESSALFNSQPGRQFYERHLKTREDIASFEKGPFFQIVDAQYKGALRSGPPKAWVTEGSEEQEKEGGKRHRRRLLRSLVDMLSR
jgi:hypothetical protein